MYIILEDVCRILDKMSKAIILIGYSIILLSLILYTFNSEYLIKAATAIFASDFLWIGGILIVFPLCANTIVTLIILLKVTK